MSSRTAPAVDPEPPAPSRFAFPSVSVRVGASRFELGCWDGAAALWTWSAVSLVVLAALDGGGWRFAAAITAGVVRATA